VLRTRPGFPSLICLPSTFRYGAYLCFDPRFCLRPPSGVHCCSTLAFGYPSPPSGWVWTFCGIYDIITATWYHTAPFSSRAKPGTQSPRIAIRRTLGAPRLSQPAAAVDCARRRASLPTCSRLIHGDCQ